MFLFITCCLYNSVPSTLPGRQLYWLQRCWSNCCWCCSFVLPEVSVTMMASWTLIIRNDVSSRLPSPRKAVMRQPTLASEDAKVALASNQQEQKMRTFTRLVTFAQHPLHPTCFGIQKYIPCCPRRENLKSQSSYAAWMCLDRPATISLPHFDTLQVSRCQHVNLRTFENFVCQNSARCGQMKMKSKLALLQITLFFRKWVAFKVDSI